MANLQKQWPSDLTGAQRLEMADAKIQQMLDLAIELIHLHENNRFVAYDKNLKAQIPLSFGGVAYRVFSKALVQRELAGVCTLWDSAKKNRSSIPTIIALLDHDDVRCAVLDRKILLATSERDLSTETDDAEMLAWITALNERDVTESANRRVELLSTAINEARAFETSELLGAARDFRNTHLAHNLSPGTKKYPELSAKMGDEGKLLEATLPILENLNLAARNSSFDWEGTWDIARRNANALWSGCRFSVLE